LPPFPPSTHAFVRRSQPHLALEIMSKRNKFTYFYLNFGKTSLISFHPVLAFPSFLIISHR
jgi:hypothetical protein